MLQHRQHNSDTITVKTLQKNVQRRQFPITGAYAFTDYQSQGQTIKSVIVDLAKPPSGGELSLFNVYVALSCSSGRDTIQLLRQIDDSMLYKPVDNSLTVEDDRLQKLDDITKAWWTTLVNSSL